MLDFVFCSLEVVLDEREHSCNHGLDCVPSRVVGSVAVVSFDLDDLE